MAGFEAFAKVRLLHGVALLTKQFVFTRSVVGDVVVYNTLK
jgi:hypothetical protein